MASRLRIPTAGLAAISVILNVAIVGCAARSLNTYNDQKGTNYYFLPMWPQHFDSRELSALIGTSIVVFILNLALVAGLFIPAISSAVTALAISLLSTALTLISLIFTSTLNARAPGHDTIQSWTCRWQNLPSYNDGQTIYFNRMCTETRFAFYTTIPSFIIQLLLVGLAITRIRNARRGAAPSHGFGMYDGEMEKGAHEMSGMNFRQGSSGGVSKTESVSQRSIEMGGRVVIANTGKP